MNSKQLKPQILQLEGGSIVQRNNNRLSSLNPVRNRHVTLDFRYYLQQSYLMELREQKRSQHANKFEDLQQIRPLKVTNILSPLKTNKHRRLR